jgi:hypothetical protein
VEGGVVIAYLIDCRIAGFPKATQPQQWSQLSKSIYLRLDVKHHCSSLRKDLQLLEKTLHVWISEKVGPAVNGLIYRT